MRQLKPRVAQLTTGQARIEFKFYWIKKPMVFIHLLMHFLKTLPPPAPGPATSTERPCRCFLNLPPNPQPKLGWQLISPPRGMGTCVLLMASSPISCVSWRPQEADDISASSWEQLICTKGGPRRLRGATRGSAGCRQHKSSDCLPSPPEDPGPRAGPLRLPEPLPARAYCLGLSPFLAHLQGFLQDEVTSWPEDHTD